MRYQPGGDMLDTCLAQQKQWMKGSLPPFENAHTNMGAAAQIQVLAYTCQPVLWL
jgi:hypothetical protein